jgi:DtxR family Mn-dependent transcriptional regulator
MERSRRGNTESVDNYLKALLVLEETAIEGAASPARITVKAMAAELRVAPASVTNMLQKLAAARAPMVEYERHRGVRLSRAGRRRALEVVRHHRLIETFLYEMLDYPIDELHDEAERLEHFISERFEQRIAAKLGHPRTDPHGHPIPAIDGRMAPRTSMPLADVDGDGTFVVESLNDRDAGLLRRMQTRGVAPGAKIDVQRRAGSDVFRVRVGRSRRPFELAGEATHSVRLARPASRRGSKRR